MAVGEANGKSSTFTMITIGYPDRFSGGPVVYQPMIYKLLCAKNILRGLSAYKP